MTEKILIAYFSRADENYFGGKLKYIKVGNTEIVAKKLEAMTGGDLFRIEPKKPYAKDYKACVAESIADKNADARPELASLPGSIDGYKTVIVAYPCYCGTMPMPVFTFLESFDFGGKTLMPLCTNEGSGMGTSVRDIKKLCPTAEVTTGLSVKGSDAENSDELLKKWLNECGKFN